MFHDNQHAYQFDFSEPDTEVSDVEEPPVISRPRVSTGELTVHVLHDGERHRRLPDLSGTSCGERYRSQFTPVLREQLTHANGPLCRKGCFTAHELAIADAEERERQP
jgi:hypothetical protein